MSQKEGIDIKDNRFFIQGEGGIKYTYNNGQVATDAKLAAMNFLNALDKIPGLIEQDQKKVDAMKRDVPVLQDVINGVWTKENILIGLKTELAALDRAIQLSIAPQEQTKQQEPVADNVNDQQEGPAKRLKAV